MKRYTTSRKLTDKSYDGLKPDQARALFLIAEAGKEGLTDVDLQGIRVNEAGEVVTDGTGNPLKVKLALLSTGSVQATHEAGPRKASERNYRYTGAPIGDDLPASLKKVGAAVAVLGFGTKGQFAEELVRQSQAEADAHATANPEAEPLAVLSQEEAVKRINAVWLRVNDRGLVKPELKGAKVEGEAPAEQQEGDSGQEEYREDNAE
jgi:hypothetical protein